MVFRWYLYGENVPCNNMYGAVFTDPLKLSVVDFEDVCCGLG